MFLRAPDYAGPSWFTADMQPTRLLRRREVQTLTGLGRSTIYDRMAHDQFPRPVRLGARSVAWLASEIDAWINARIVESRPGTGEVQP
jgi:prophage regulatory protein